MEQYKQRYATKCSDSSVSVLVFSYDFKYPAEYQNAVIATIFNRVINKADNRSIYNTGRKNPTEYCSLYPILNEGMLNSKNIVNKTPKSNNDNENSPFRRLGIKKTPSDNKGNMKNKKISSI
jgi:hypothetical protein